MSETVSLNFSPAEKKQLLALLKEFEELTPASSFEEFRCRKNACTLTLYKTGKLLLQGKDAGKVRDFLLSKLTLPKEIVLGFDEAGRGEDFGVMAVAAVLADKNLMRELRDSKKIKKSNLQAKKDFVSKNVLAYSVTVFSPQLIDECREKGINLNELECRVIKANSEIFSFKKGVRIVIDGLPLSQCRNVGEFIPKGDDSHPVISASSVLAKYAREQSKNKNKRKSWNLKTEK